MKTENYILQYILKNNISIQKIEMDTGINMERMVCEGKELLATDFFALCVYLGIKPDDIRDQIF